MNDKYEIIKELKKRKKLTDKVYRKILSKFPKEKRALYSKSELLEEYRKLVSLKKLKVDKEIEDTLKTKPARTLSGVVPVTVLTKPYPCPGSCIFCPTMSDQPKSYLSSEPGAMRARMLKFDPYLQAKVRIQALKNIGHNTDKIELIILGGTWSYYPRNYQLWFVKECFRGLNDSRNQDDIKNLLDNIDQLGQVDQSDKFDQNILKKQLIIEQKKNETAKHRCIGLAVETRPDFVNKEEVKFLRFLGATKIQLGVQTLSDKLLKLNKRGHSVDDSKKAAKLLRLAGFKLHVHWMFNLYGSDLEGDYKDFKKLIDDKSLKPDELKLYPCVLLKNTPLYKIYKEGKYKPYTRDELLELLIKCKRIIPKYCRVSRLFRDIPSFEIKKSVKETNFREIVKKEMEKRKLMCNCIRCREIKSGELNDRNLELDIIKYKINVGWEYFLSYITEDNKIVGFLRLLIPFSKYSHRHYINEISSCAIIREVHIYGVVKQLGSESVDNEDGVQHMGLGSKLIIKAEEIARKNRFDKIAVISAIGTREYYKKRGYSLGELYMRKDLSSGGIIDEFDNRISK